MASHIDIQREHALGAEGARAVIDGLADRLYRKFGVTPNWRGSVLHFSRHGVEGFIEAGAHHVHVHVKLGLLLSPLRPTVEAEILNKLDEYFL